MFTASKICKIPPQTNGSGGNSYVRKLLLLLQDDEDNSGNGDHNNRTDDGEQHGVVGSLNLVVSGRLSLSRLGFSGLVHLTHDNCGVLTNSLAYVGKAFSLDYDLKAGHNYVVALAEAIADVLEILTQISCIFSNFLP